MNPKIGYEVSHSTRRRPRPRRRAPLYPRPLPPLWTVTKLPRWIGMDCSVLFFSRPRSQGWPHHGRTFSIYPCPRSFWLTLPRLDVVHPGRAWPSSPACTWHCSLHYLFLQATPLFPHGVYASFLALTVSNNSLYSSLVKNPLICFLCCPRNSQNLSQSFHLKGVRTCFFILSESPAFTAIRCYRPH